MISQHAAPSELIGFVTATARCRLKLGHQALFLEGFDLGRDGDRQSHVGVAAFLGGNSLAASLGGRALATLVTAVGRIKHWVSL